MTMSSVEIRMRTNAPVAHGQMTYFRPYRVVESDSEEHTVGDIVVTIPAGGSTFRSLVFNATKGKIVPTGSPYHFKAERALEVETISIVQNLEPT